MTIEPPSYLAELQRNYSASGLASPPGSLPFGPDPALLVIDVCIAHLTPSSPLHTPTRFHTAPAAPAPFISYCRARQTPAFFLRVVYPTPLSSSKRYNLKLPNALFCFHASNQLGDCPRGDEECRPQEGEMVIEKHSSSAFSGPALASQLVGMKVDTLMMCGSLTSGCVRATTGYAMQYGFSPCVVGEACGDRHAYPHYANLFDVQAKFGESVYG